MIDSNKIDSEKNELLLENYSKHKIQDLAHAMLPEVIRNRRYLRQHPEASREEFNTQKYLLSELAAMGIEGKPCFITGITADIKGNHPGKTIALRADIDALRLNDESGLPFASVNEGVCHGCGHDAHMSVLLGAARVFAKLEGDFPGTIRLIFQPSEEFADGGARHMIDEGCLDGVDYILGNHIWQPQPFGTVGIVSGPIMASVTNFEIHIQGHGGHGSMPDTAISPITVAADIVQGINEIVGNNIPSLERVSVSIGKLNSGTAFNIIPDKAVLGGSIRTFSEAMIDIVEKRLQAIAAGSAQKYGATAEVIVRRIYPAVVNDTYTTKVFTDAAQQIMGTDQVQTVVPSMASEDFSFYQKKVPGTFFFLGTGNQTCIYPHHHPKFMIDEGALENGVALMAYGAVCLAEA